MRPLSLVALLAAVVLGTAQQELEQHPQHPHSSFQHPHHPQHHQLAQQQQQQQQQQLALRHHEYQQRQLQHLFYRNSLPEVRFPYPPEFYYYFYPYLYYIVFGPYPPHFWRHLTKLRQRAAFFRSLLNPFNLHAQGAAPTISQSATTVRPEPPITSEITVDNGNEDNDYPS